ncbi:uncharacterized protein LOC141911319 [Tubulanus polymorphus]|uniref:uncharacterized protein LOC141911319 n=1 Tax=Tubulanus polymorphus TaxID=672921 RepID=UPI003DA62619
MDQLQIMFVAAVLQILLLAQGTALSNLTCASCWRDYGSSYGFAAMNAFAKKVGISAIEDSSSTNECKKSIYEGTSTGLKFVNDKLESYKTNVKGTACPIDHTCVKVTNDDENPTSYIRGCMLKTDENCKLVHIGGSVTQNVNNFYVFCCDDFSYCNSAAIYRMNLLIIVGVILGALQFLDG